MGCPLPRLPAFLHAVSFAGRSGEDAGKAVAALADQTAAKLGS